jgi:hypothetical protein
VLALLALLAVFAATPVLCMPAGTVLLMLPVLALARSLLVFVLLERLCARMAPAAWQPPGLAGGG